MPNRIIKESICVSRKVNQLSSDEEVFFYRLLVNCDDYGTFYGDPGVLSAKLFPRRRYRDEIVKKWRDRLCDVGLSKVFVHEGETYIQVLKWEENQQIRSKRRKYPTPPADTMKSDDINGYQMISNAPVIQSNPIRIQSESNPNSSTAVDVFEDFWKAYPRKVDKADARKVYRKIANSLSDPKGLVMAAEEYSEHCQRERTEEKYIKHAATFLRDERWVEWAEKAKSRSAAEPVSKYPDHSPTEIVAEPGEIIHDCREALQEKLREYMGQ